MAQNRFNVSLPKTTEAVNYSCRNVFLYSTQHFEKPCIKIPAHSPFDQMFGYFLLIKEEEQNFLICKIHNCFKK